MKKSIFAKLFVVASLLFTVVACNKYEEGSNFSLLTAKARVSNNWTSTSYSVVSSFATVTSDESALNIQKDGSYTHVGTMLSLPFDEVGTWQFNGDKTQLLLTEVGGTAETWDIIKLKNKELKLTKTETLFGIEYTITIDYSGE